MSEDAANRAVDLAEKAGDKIGAGIDKTGELLANFASALGDVAKQYGPDVVNGLLEVARIDAISALIPSALVAVALVIGANYYIKLCKVAWNYCRTEYDPTVLLPIGFGSLIAAVPVCVIGNYAFSNLFDIWRWVGAFKPEIWVARRVLGKVLNLE